MVQLGKKLDVGILARRSLRVVQQTTVIRGDRGLERLKQRAYSTIPFESTLRFGT